MFSRGPGEDLDIFVPSAYSPLSDFYLDGRDTSLLRLQKQYTFEIIVAVISTKILYLKDRLSRLCTWPNAFSSA